MYNYDVIEFDAQLKDKPQIKVQINATAEEILSFIERIKSEMGKAISDFNLLKELCFELLQRLPLPIQQLQDTFILRSRENYNGEIFSSALDLSYNPFPERISIGRFNLGGESAFYGAAPITSHQASGQLTTICETCKELFDSASQFETKYFTIGKWNIRNPLKIVIMTFFKDAEKSFHLQNLNPHYHNFLSSICSQEDVAKCLGFYSLISECAAKKKDDCNSYLFTTSFMHALKQYYGNEIGILYSSSMTENKGLNIVLSKQVLDAQQLEWRVL